MGCTNENMYEQTLFSSLPCQNRESAANKCSDPLLFWRKWVKPEEIQIHSQLDRLKEILVLLLNLKVRPDVLHRFRQKLQVTPPNIRTPWYPIRVKSFPSSRDLSSWFTILHTRYLLICTNQHSPPHIFIFFNTCIHLFNLFIDPNTF